MGRRFALGGGRVGRREVSEMTKERWTRMAKIVAAFYGVPLGDVLPMPLFLRPDCEARLFMEAVNALAKIYRK